MDSLKTFQGRPARADVFQSLKRFRDASEAEVVAAFDSTRAAMDDLENQRIVKRLPIEVIGHLEEHALG